MILRPGLFRFDRFLAAWPHVGKHYFWSRGEGHGSLNRGGDVTFDSNTTTAGADEAPDYKMASVSVAMVSGFH